MVSQNSLADYANVFVHYGILWFEAFCDADMKLCVRSAHDPKDK